MSDSSIQTGKRVSKAKKPTTQPQGKTFPRKGVMQLRFPESIAPLRLMPEQRRTFIRGIVSWNIIHYPGANRWQKTAVSTETHGPVNKTALAVTVDGTADARRWGAMRFTYLCDPVRCRYAVRGCQRHNISAALQYSRRP